MTSPRSQLDFRQFEILTFDCYGTLIDWEQGILDAVSKALAAHSHQVSSEDVLSIYSELEPAAQGGLYKSYREILQLVMRRLGKRLGVIFSDEEERSLAESLPTWKPFPDTVAALKQLKARYKLGIISNIDDDLFAQTAQHLQVIFDHVVTAQQVGSYKPSLRNFEEALKEIGLPRKKVLHAAESVYHDIIPANKLGIASVWVNRRMNKEGSGATQNAAGKPDLTVPDLKTLAEMAA